MLLSALTSLALYGWVFLRLRRKLHVLKPASEYVLNEEDQEDEYKVKLSRYMIYYPVRDPFLTLVVLMFCPHQLAYFVAIVPIAIARFLYYGGHEVPFALTVVTDSIYYLLGKAFHHTSFFFLIPMPRQD
jgi:hypothetical protein